MAAFSMALWHQAERALILAALNAARFPDHPRTRSELARTANEYERLAAGADKAERAGLL